MLPLEDLLKIAEENGVKVNKIKEGEIPCTRIGGRAIYDIKKEMKSIMEKEKVSVDKILEDGGFEFYGINNLANFVSGSFSRKKNGNVRMTIELPNEIIKESVAGIPMKTSDYKLVPAVMFLKVKKEV